MFRELPKRLWIVRHGESAGNVARLAAHAAGQLEIDTLARDMDVPLSSRGVRQAMAIGQWFAKLPPAEQPQVVRCSPYLRARTTAALLIGETDLGLSALSDERLRERELGVLNRLTSRGVATRFPEEARRKEQLGKFYHRPATGESWCDVFLRLRSAWSDLASEHVGRNVLLVGHQITVLGFRYLLERLNEQQILAIDREGEIANCSITSYSFADGEPRRELFNFVSPVSENDAPVTAEPDAPAALS